MIFQAKNGPFEEGLGGSLYSSPLKIAWAPKGHLPSMDFQMTMLASGSTIHGSSPWKFGMENPHSFLRETPTIGRIETPKTAPQQRLL